MKEGRIICEGNPAELKAREGEGYKLNVKMKHLHQKKDLDDFLRKNLMNIHYESEKEKWLTYNLNGNISEMLGILATAKHDFELEGFTINMISLEDVFLQVTKGSNLEYLKSVDNIFHLSDKRSDSLVNEATDISGDQGKFNFSNDGYMPEQNTGGQLDVECSTPVYLEPKKQE